VIAFVLYRCSLVLTVTVKFIVVTSVGSLLDMLALVVRKFGFIAKIARVSMHFGAVNRTFVWHAV